MLYFYFVVGRARPYLIDIDAVTVDVAAPGSRPTRILPDWPGLFVKAEVGLSRSSSRPHAKSLSCAWNATSVQDAVVAAGNVNWSGFDVAGGAVVVESAGEQSRVARMEWPLRSGRRVRSRSAFQLRARSISPPPPPPRMPPDARHARQDEAIPMLPLHYPEHPEHPAQTYTVLASSSSQPPLDWLEHHDPSATGVQPSSQQYRAYRRPSPRQRILLPARRQSTIDLKPLPPLPSRFRLGEPDLPWSSSLDVPYTYSPGPSFDHSSASTPQVSTSHPASSLRSAVRSWDIADTGPSVSHFSSLSMTTSPVSPQMAFTFSPPSSTANNMVSPESAYGSLYLQERRSPSPLMPPIPTFSSQYFDHSLPDLYPELTAQPNHSASPFHTNEDPARGRQLAAFQNATMTIDSVEAGVDWWDPSSGTEYSLHHDEQGQATGSHEYAIDEYDYVSVSDHDLPPEYQIVDYATSAAGPTSATNSAPSTERYSSYIHPNEPGWVQRGDVEAERMYSQLPRGPRGVGWAVRVEPEIGYGTGEELGVSFGRRDWYMNGGNWGTSIGLTRRRSR